MLRWRFHADNAALRTVVGDRIGGHIRVRADRGCALDGPRLEMPAGRGVARIRFAGPVRGRAQMDIVADNGRRPIGATPVDLRGTDAGMVALPFVLDQPVADLEVRLFCRPGFAAEILGVEIDLDRGLRAAPLDPDRLVGYESRKTYADKVASGFFDRYLSGPNVMEVGYRGYEGGTATIVPQAIGVDIGYAGYDGTSFPFADGSFDAIYSSHCFEHIGPWKEVLRDWHRLLRVGGFLVVIVPHQHLFERKRHLPSSYNGDHKRFYTSAGLLGEIEAAYEENSFRVRHLVENDRDFDYGPPPGEPTTGCYEIELVVEKIARPAWTLDDGSVRTYNADEFRTTLPPDDPWSLPLDCSQAGRCIVWGPYPVLRAGAFTATFHFAPIPIGADETMPELAFDVALDMARVQARTVMGDEARAILSGGRLAIPFRVERDEASAEFRIFTGETTARLRPVLRGVVIAYDRHAGRDRARTDA